MGLAKFMSRADPSQTRAGGQGQTPSGRAEEMGAQEAQGEGQRPQTGSHVGPGD